MDYDIDFQRSFVHTDWLDQVDRVSAGGDNGFNVRFHTLEADLDVLGDRVARINTALNSVRGELHAGVGMVAGDGAGTAQDGTFGFEVFAVPEPHDFLVRLGPGVVGGVPVAARGTQRYSAQPWTDPAVAAAAGVAPIGPLSTPELDRLDVVYVDSWARVGGAGDLVQEVAVRVAEGTTTPPPAPAGHVFLTIARLSRREDEAVILAADIEDRRVFVDRSPAVRTLTLTPALLPAAEFAAWTQTGFGAEGRTTQGFVRGFMPVVLPHRARLLSLRYRGRHSTGSSNTVVELRRSTVDGTTVFSLAFDSVTGSGAFDRTLPVASDAFNDLIDHNAFAYTLRADTTGGGITLLHSVTFTYVA